MKVRVSITETNHHSFEIDLDDYIDSELTGNKRTIAYAEAINHIRCDQETLIRQESSLTSAEGELSDFNIEAISDEEVG